MHSVHGTDTFKLARKPPVCNKICKTNQADTGDN